MIKARIHIVRALCLVVAGFAMLFSGCTRNNGDIGLWFGTWHMLSVTADGETETGYDKDIFWSFQNDILLLTRIQTGNDGIHRVERRYGTWREDGDMLFINFSYSDDHDHPDYTYRPFEELHMPHDSEVPLTIEKKSGTNIILRYNSPDGVKYTYTLKKQS